MAADDNEIRVALTADFSGLVTGMDAGAEAVSDGAQDMSDAMAEVSAGAIESQAQIVAAIEAASAQITAAVTGVSTRLDALSTGYAESAAEAASAATEISTATATAGATITGVGESAEAAAERIRQMVQSSLQLAEAERAGQASAVEHTAATEEETAAAWAQADADARLIQLQNESMAQTSEAIAATEELTAAKVADTAATEGQAAATAELGVASAAAGQEMNVMLAEAMRGNFGRLDDSLVTLAERTGVLHTALSLVASPLGLIGGALGVAGAAAFQADEQFDAMQRAVLSTGNAANLSAGDLVAMADNIGQTTGNLSEAHDAMLRFAQSGRFVASDIGVAAQAAVQMSQLTGDSIEQTSNKIMQLQQDPLRAAVALTEQFHFLSVAEYEQMQSMVAAGNSTDAAALAIRSLNTRMQEAAEQAESSANVIVRAWHGVENSVKSAYHAMGQNLDVMLGGGDLAERIEVQKRAVDALQTSIDATKAQGGSDPGGEAMLAKRKADLQDLQRQWLQVAFAQQQSDAKGAGDAQTIRDIQEQDQLNDKLKGTALLQEKIAQEKQRVESIHSAAPDSSSIQGLQFDPSGQLIQQGQRWDAILKELTSEYGQVSNASGSAAAAQRRQMQQLVEEGREDSRAAMNELADKRDATKQYSDQRMDVDREIVTAAAELYGEDSEQYRQANRQKINDERAFQQEKTRLAEQGLSDNHQSSTQDLAYQRQQDQALYQDKQVSAQKLLQLENSLAQQQLTIDEKYWADKRAVDAAAGDLQAVQRDDAAVLAAKTTFNRQLLANDQQYHREVQQEWRQTETRITSSMATAMNSVIFQGQRVKSALASVIETMGEQWIRTMLQTLAQHVMVEQTKTAATVSGNATRVASNAAAAATTKATDAATAKGEITNAAASGAAKAYQAVVGIPVVGPILAPIAAGVAFAGIELFGGSISSAAGGWDTVPNDQIAQIHKNEMILPAHIAGPLRDMIAAGNAGGGGGDTNHFHISAIDAKSFRSFLRSGGGTELAAYAKTKIGGSGGVRR